MRVVTAAQMRKIDQTAVDDFGVPGVVLMENAGRHVAEVACRILRDICDSRVVIFAGKGNNGGDGLVAARHLYNMGARVRVVLLAEPEAFKGDAAVNLAIWQRMNGHIDVLGFGDDDLVSSMVDGSDLVVDAIFGTGFSGTVRGTAAKVIEAVNAGKKPVIAVDMPSGVEADSGAINGPCVRADYTVAFGLPKVGHLLHPGAEYTGELYVADISIPRPLLKCATGVRQLITEGKIRDWLPKRPPTAHKSSVGRVLVVAGSRDMMGAACLTAMSALRGGAGLVTLAVPEGMQEIAAVKLVEVVTRPLPQTNEGTIGFEALKQVYNLLEHVDVLAIGPGITTHPETAGLVRELLPALTLPCVLDADALNALAGHSSMLNKNVSAQLILTPHPGEMARLLDMTTAEVVKDRLQVVEGAAARWDKVVLLKGAPTLVASPNGTTYFSNTGNAGMATAGSGDVLTGLIAALIGQGMGIVEAAASGAYLHGLAGDIAASELGVRSITAGDILEYLPATFKKIEDGEDK